MPAKFYLQLHQIEHPTKLPSFKLGYPVILEQPGNVNIGKMDIVSGLLRRISKSLQSRGKY